MVVFINPGSRINNAPVGWTNTYETALEAANDWLARMRADGFTDITMTGDETEQDGRWRFIFTHQVTNVSVELETHGIDNLKAYERQTIFSPRLYWNGSSSANPKLADFAAEGFEPVRTFRKA